MKTTVSISICIVCVLAGIGVAEETPDKLPLWEFGVLGAAARLPHYAGSDEYNIYAFPMPYVIYRGRVFQCDREGLRGIFFKREHLESSISLFGLPPVDKDNRARAGMPRLDGIFAIGPALKWYPCGRLPDDSFFAKFSIRGASSIGMDDGLDIAYRGLSGKASLTYLNRSLFKEDRLSFGVSLAGFWGNDPYHDYFYTVEEAYAQSDRPAYNAGSGYAGFSLSSGLYKRLTDDVSIGCYASWNNINEAVFEDSPLVKAKNNYVLGCALIWRLATSKRFVDKNRMPVIEDN